MKDAAIPPVFSGLPLADPGAWEPFRVEYLRALGPLHAEYSAFCVERGARPLPEGDLMHASPHLNLYVYPRGARLSARGTARADLAPSRHVRARAPTTTSSHRRATAGSSTCRWARSGRPTSG